METDVEKTQSVRAAFERASALLRVGDIAVAESICRDALDRFPEDGNLQCLLGALLIRKRHLGEAEMILRGVADRFPEFAKAHEELANALQAQNRPDEAVVCLQRTVELEPDNGLAHYKLGKLLAATGSSDEAQEAYSASVLLAPVQNALARAAELRNAGQFSEAEKICQEALTQEPDNAEIFHTLGVLAMEQEQFGDAAVLLRRTVSLAPEMVVAWMNLSKALAEREEFNQALDAIQHAMTLEPGSALPYVIAGEFQARMAQHREAIDAYRAGLEIQPDNAACLSGLGYALKTIGRYEDAVRTYRDLIEMHPDYGDAYWSLANLKNVCFAPGEVQAMEDRVSNESITEETRIEFCFALGKAYEDQADYERAFDYYQRGNSARRMNERYDAQYTQAMTVRIIEVFNKETVKNKAMTSDDDPVPIFIIGLPRSGSTLIEQILASHSQVEGTRELPDLDRLIGTVNRKMPYGAPYPDALQQLSSDELSVLGRQYLETTQRYRTGKPCFTDKMPNNFRHIGLISMILPNAKVIDARRHPLDSCLGSYKQLFIKGQPFTYDLFELGEYYLEYRRLMDHWHSLLPGHVLDIQYEEIVRGPEPQIRRLLEHCELPWEDNCLNFHETDRAIDSASSEQVRQPIYQSSVNNWRNYEAQLGELIAILKPLLKQLPEDQQPAGI